MIAPPAERFRPDHVGAPLVRCDKAMADANGAIGRPWRVLDTLARMERSGRITRGMRSAGLYFNECFNAAGLDPLWAADPGRLPVLTHNGKLPGRRGSPSAIEIVLDSVSQLGGLTSPGGSAAWGILGCEMTIESWAISRSWGKVPIDRHMATGILLTDLGILQKYYAMA